ncbi:hypothetical protein ABZU25_21455 [Micromonospora sp. NPDC005215]|uniref:hypothetical protein n=1 Tax=Micromonospora sp. NPDC005215 TaxID=3157024 RepID=UPI0033A1B3D1
MQPNHLPTEQIPRPPLVPVQSGAPTVPVHPDEPTRPPGDATADPALAHLSAPLPDQTLSARLAHWIAAAQVVADVVKALDTRYGMSLTVGLLHTPVGSDHLPDINTIVLSPKYATPELVAVADKLILYRLATAFEHLGVNTLNGQELRGYNHVQQQLWRLANPPQDPPPANVYRFYHGTNRCNYYGDGIQVTGLIPGKAGSDIGCKRWEKHDVISESKDKGWNTVTLDFDLALSYARQHTEWAMGKKRNEPTLRDVAGEGGLVLAFDVPKNDIDGNEAWRHDHSGDANNFQTKEEIPAQRIRVVEELGIPGPLEAVAPPPKSDQAPKAVAPPPTSNPAPKATSNSAPGARRRLVPGS